MKSIASRFHVVAFLLIATTLPQIAYAAEPAGDADLFRDRVALILERRCVGCHNDADRKGGFSLETPDQAFKGGDSGAVIAPGDPGSSYLLDLVNSNGGHAEMPKDGTPLPEEDVTAIRRWIAAGADWPAEIVLDPNRIADTDWWSLQPIVRPAVPTIPPDDVHAVRNPVDAFVLAKLREQGLEPSLEADRRTLIRRLSFDLLGLPPSPEQVTAFLADPDPLAYEHLVDRLLASPHYGERWARHWLDVAHYGDSHGYDKDQPRPNAWPYRDYVIRAFNDDKPYDRFVREQIAGDALFPDSPDSIVATGFLAAGPWDLISHVEVPESKIDGQIARSLDRDDFVRTVMETFTSTTVGCARCHNHKFDPIPQADYYSLQAVFGAIDRADRPYDLDPEVRGRRLQLLAEKEAIEAERTAAESAYHDLEDAELRPFREAVADLVAEQPSRPEFGYHSGIETRPDVAKWVQIDLGRSHPIAEVVLIGCHDDFAGIGAGFGFPVRFRIEASDDPTFQTAVSILADQSAIDGPNPGVVPRRFTAGGQIARYLRVTATRLAPRQNDFIFALAEVRVLSSDGTNVAAGGVVTSLDSIDALPRWARGNLTDGIWLGSDAPPEFTDRMAAAQAGLNEAKARLATSNEAQHLAELRPRSEKVDQRLASLPAPRIVYAAATDFPPQGNFRPTEGRSREIRLLRRGDVRSPAELVAPGTLAAVTALPDRFELPLDAPEGAARAALADWLAHHDNPLTWRSIANRAWLYHFGRGIVDTPNDFGRMGLPPSHPELLDWLAVEFRDSSGSLKHLHRLIVTSAAYRRSSAHDPKAAAIDAENRFLWRMNRRRLEAEEVRDAVLVSAGGLDERMYGPAFQDFVIDKPEHSPHYLYHLHDPNDPASHRRTVYRFIVRSQPQPFLTTLDCADASMSVDKRNETVTPLQALTLLNNPFMVALSERFAHRLADGAEDRGAQIEAAFRLAVGRPPAPEERRRLSEYAERHGLANACRLVLNLNEFVYVD